MQGSGEVESPAAAGGAILLLGRAFPVPGSPLTASPPADRQTTTAQD
jgi:hypothetical protein